MARKSRKNVDFDTATSMKFEKSTEMPVYNVAAYIRHSVEDTKKRGDTIETQKMILENFIAINPELKFYDFYIDNGFSGTTFERPEFKRLLSDIEKGKINCVIVKDLSRLGRNSIDSGFYIEKYFPLHNVRFIAVNDGFDNNDKSSAQSITVPLKNMMNEIVALNLSKSTKAQIQQSMKDGKYVGSTPVYGYSKDQNDCHKLVIDKVSSIVVKQIFEWFCEGVSLNQIAVRLNETKVLSPSRYAESKGWFNRKNSSYKGMWQTWSVSAIIDNPICTGDMVQGRTKVVNHKQVRVPEEEWIIIPNTHEAIISRGIFECAKSIRKERLGKTKSMKAKSIPYTLNIFKGKIFCGHCGGSLNRERWNGKIVYSFRCIANERIAKGTCLTVTIKETNLIEMILILLQEQSTIITGKYLLMHEKNILEKENHKKKKSEMMVLKQSIEQNQKFLKSLYENLVRGVIDDSEYLEMKNAYESKIQISLSSIEAMERKELEDKSQLKHYRNLSDNIKNISDNTELTAALIDKLVDRIEVFENKSIEVKFRYQSDFERRFDE